VFEAIDVDRPPVFGRYNPLRTRGRSYLYRGPRGPVEIKISSGGKIASLMGPDIVADKVPCGVSDWYDPLNKGGGRRYRETISLLFRFRKLAACPWWKRPQAGPRWRAYRTSAYLFRWNMIDAENGRPFVKARAWNGQGG